MLHGVAPAHSTVHGPTPLVLAERYAAHASPSLQRNK